jgi:predicted ATPase
MKADNTPEPEDTIMATVPSQAAAHQADDYTLPPFLRRVRIRGYKSIAFCDVKLHPLTILVGRNAAGKSNFLDALAFVRDAMDSGLADALKRRGGIPGILCRSLPAESISIEIEGSLKAGAENTGFIVQYRIEIETAKPFPDERPRENLSIRNVATNQSFGFRTQDDKAIFFGKGDLSGPAYNLSPDLFLRIDVNEPDHSFFRSLKNMAFYNFHPESSRALQTPNPGTMLDKDGRNLASVIEALKEFDPGSAQRVGDYLSTIAEEVEGFDVVHYGEYETVRFRLRGPEPNKAIECDAASMSDGTLRALGCLVAVFQRSRWFMPSVVGIEEPETALHPAAMRALVDAVDDATQRTQVLLTTHSADLLSGRDVTPGQVLVVRNRGGLTYITPVDAASRQIVQKELYSLAELQRMDKLDLDESDLERQAQLSRQGGA